MNKLSIFPIIIGSLSFYPIIGYADLNDSRPNYKLIAQQSNTVKYKNLEKPKDENTDSGKVLIWEKVIDNEIILEERIKWELDYSIDSEKDLLQPKNYREKIDYLKKIEYGSKKKLELGESVPTAKTLNQGEINIYFGQVSPIKGSYGSSGTGNQNYLFSSYYGINDDITFGIFYTHSDDPLHRKINNESSPIANRWISYGSSLRWNVFKNKNKNKRMTIIGSLENWNVKSGGCNLYKCSSTSSNIFNSSTNSVENDNIIGSLSLPVSWDLTKKLTLSLTPRAFFLPKRQGNNDGYGDFYGPNIGLGAGFEYKPFSRVKVFSSSFIPIGTSNNSFDSNLVFTSKNIFTSGINYYLDNKISFEASLTNSFGQSPGTSILTIPSDNEILYGLKAIYRPNNYTWQEVKGTRGTSNIHDLNDGLSVANANIIKQGSQRVRLTFNDKETWSYKHEWGASELFNIDLSILKISESIADSNPLNSKYHALEKVYIRGGGKAMLLSQDRGDLITTSLRISAGRLMGNGWVLGEVQNSYKLNKVININLNPKLALSGVKNPTSLGAGISWKLTPHISFIPETNIAIREAETNWTIALRFSDNNNKYIDLFTTNSLGFVDTGSIIKSKDQSFGINIGTIF